MYITCGLAFLDTRLIDIMEHIGNGLGWTMLFIMVLTLCVAVSLFLLDAHGARNAKQIKSAIMVAVCKHLPKLRATIMADGTDHDVQLWLLAELSDERLREAFDEMDTDRDGVLHHNEVFAALIKLGNADDETLQAAMAKLEERVTRFEEFKELQSRIAEDSRLAQLEKAVCLGAMNSADLELLKVLGSVNGVFKPAHLASILFPGRARSASIKNLVKSVSRKFVPRQASAVLDTSDSLTMKQRTAITESLGDDELSATFESEPMRMWVRETFEGHRENAVDQLMHYLQTNQALREWVSDGAKCSIYAQDDKACFFRSIVKGSPFVVDALLESSCAEIQRFSAVIDWMFAARMRHGREGSLSRLIVEIDRAPVAQYLTHSTTDRKCRDAALALLRDIWKVFTNSAQIKTKQSFGFQGRWQLSCFLGDA